MDKRNYTIDIMRLFTMYGVIVLHVPSQTYAATVLSKIFWPVSVPFFYVTSLTYYVAGLSKATWQSQLIKMRNRILIPYLAWTFIYLSLFLIKGLVTHSYNHVLFSLGRTLFYGESAVHLYFLTTLIFLQVTATAIYLLFIEKSKKNKVPGIIMLLSSIAYFSWGVFHQCFGLPVIGSIAGIIFYTITAFLVARIKPGEINHKYLMTVIGSCLVLGAITCNLLGLLFLFAGYPLILPLGGIGLFLIAVSLPLDRLPQWLNTVTTLSYGIYLSHVVFLEAFEFAMDKWLPGNINYDLFTKLIEVTILFLVAAVFTAVVRRFGFLRMALLGEKKYSTT